MLDTIHESFPFTAFPSSVFCDIELGVVFAVPNSTAKYLLMQRDAFKVTLVRWNWWSQLWWGKYRREPVTN